MKPSVCVFTISWNEALMMPFFLRHYSTFADKIIVFDEHSTDGTREIVSGCSVAELRDWPHFGLDDNRFMEAVNEWYKEARGKYDWVMWPDCDEILHHPDMVGMLSKSNADMIQAEGYGMISKHPLAGFDDQIYSRFQSGIRQPNYDKFLIWKSNVDIKHQHGRHTYAPEWPKCSGLKEAGKDLRLLHYHYFGVDHTAARNRRNYARAIDKKFAWNYAANANNNPKQEGSVAWVKTALESGVVSNVFTKNTKKLKLHLGCGGHVISGWENHDMDMDIRKPLPLENESASHIFCEHCVEHITYQEAWRFFEECYRVLCHNGVMRIAVPDFVKLARCITQEYIDCSTRGGHGDGSRLSVLKSVAFDHGHMALWTHELLRSVISEIGFQASPCQYGDSSHIEMRNLEQHWKTVGINVAQLETCIVEGVKTNQEENTSNSEQVIIQTPTQQQADDLSPQTAQIYIVSNRQEAKWTYYLLRSIERFSSGFSGIVLSVPVQDVREFRHLPSCVKLTTFEESKSASCCYTQQVLNSDITLPATSHIFHIDSRCVFWKKFTPSDFMADGRCLITRASDAPDTTIFNPRIYPRKLYSAARYAFKNETYGSHKSPFAILNLTAINEFKNDFVVTDYDIEQDAKELGITIPIGARYIHRPERDFLADGSAASNISNYREKWNDFMHGKAPKYFIL